MTDEDVQILKLAFRAALATRRETFLARYPRSLKLTVVGLPILALILFSFENKGPALTHDTRELAAQTVSEQHADHPQPASASTEKAPVKAHDVPPPVPAVSYKETINEEQLAAIARNDDYENAAGLIPAPDPSLVEKESFGELPAIARDGSKPWEIYARPFDRLDPRPRIALVMGNLGLSRIATDSAIHRLPGPVTLAFDVHDGALGNWLTRARTDGHETLLALPMEPLDFPRDDPGPGALLLSLSNADNVGRLLNFLTYGTGYIGITSFSGSRFLTESRKVSPILEVLKKRGLLILDTQKTQQDVLGDLAREKGVPSPSVTVVIDDQPSPEKIKAALERVENIARLKGSVVALASPLPLTLEILGPWIENLKKRGLALAPLSAVVTQEKAAHAP